MQRTIIFLYCAILLCFTLSAQEQEGYVRSSGSEKHKGEAIEGVVLRPQGGNDVLSDSIGHYVMILQNNVTIGDAFQIVKIYKKGYEPIDKNILNRHFIYSREVPIEIVMVSTEYLLKTRTKIETEARKKAEKRYKTLMDNLKKELKSKRISNEDFQQKKDDLIKQLQMFEKLITRMADYYARTDYNKLDSLNLEINKCIKNGELEKADSLINTKGDIKMRAIENIKEGKQIKEAEIFLDNYEF